MRRLKPVSLNVKNIGRDGKKTTISIPLEVDFGRQPEKSTQENNKEIDSPEEQASRRILWHIRDIYECNGAKFERPRPQLSWHNKEKCPQ